MNYQIEEGFGPIDQVGQAPADEQCWNVRSIKVVSFKDAELAEAFAAKWYEKRIKKLMELHGNDWQSYWVRVLPSKG